MGNTGIRKLWFLDSPVETHYKSIYQIDVINIHKQEESLKQFEGQQSLIVNVAIDSPKLNQQLEYLKTLPYQVLLFPKCDKRYTYKEIAQKLEGFKIYQKVELNGEYTHPLYKFLKRNTPELYNAQLANGYNIREDFCKFLISEDGKVLRYLHCDEKLHLYRNPTWISKLLIQEYTNIKSEELAFRYAALAKLRVQELDFHDMHQRDVEEQWEISKMSLLPQIFTLLTNMHRVTRQEPILQLPQVEAINRITALMDPNMFPVQDLQLKLHTSDTVSVWKSKKQQRVLKNVGFKLEVRPSSIDHQDAGDGVFLQTAQPNQRLVPPGTLLGFVPGLFYDNYEEFNERTPPDMHFFRFDGPILDFTAKIYHPYHSGFQYDDYAQKAEEIAQYSKHSIVSYRNRTKGGFQKVNGEDINPYAVGHKINHTPINSTTNVCLIDIFVPQTFFPEDLMRFWPSQIHSTELDQMKKSTFFSHHYKNHIRGLGIISVKDIMDGEELFLDYLESCLFDMNIDPPDWLIKPPPLHPQITKCNLRKENLIVSWLEDYAFSKTKDGQNFDRFYRKVIRELNQQIL